MLTQIRSEFSRLPICFCFSDTMIIGLCELDLSYHCFALAVHGGHWPGIRGCLWSGLQPASQLPSLLFLPWALGSTHTMEHVLFFLPPVHLKVLPSLSTTLIPLWPSDLSYLPLTLYLTPMFAACLSACLFSIRLGSSQGFITASPYSPRLGTQTILGKCFNRSPDLNSHAQVSPDPSLTDLSRWEVQTFQYIFMYLTET